MIVVTADKGLCGSFNTNVIKAGGRLRASSSAQPCTLGLVGRKGTRLLQPPRLRRAVRAGRHLPEAALRGRPAIAQTAIDAFLAGKVDRVMLVYNEFKSVMTQRVVVDQLLPIARGDVEATGSASRRSPPGGDPRAQIDYLYEPSPQEIFNQLLPRYVEVQVYRALLESNAAFFAAQMTAMDTATKNSAEMIANLTLYMNKVRQAAITREIIEVVSGAEAL